MYPVAADDAKAGLHLDKQRASTMNVVAPCGLVRRHDVGSSTLRVRFE